MEISLQTEISKIYFTSRGSAAAQNPYDMQPLSNVTLQQRQRTGACPKRRCKTHNLSPPCGRFSPIKIPSASFFFRQRVFFILSFFPGIWRKHRLLHIRLSMRLAANSDSGGFTSLLCGASSSSGNAHPSSIPAYPGHCSSCPPEWPSKRRSPSHRPWA